MKVTIFFPRLDCSFKPGAVPEHKGPPNHPVRTHWIEFLTCLEMEHERRGDDIEVVELPLWQITPGLVSTYVSDVIYIPHKMKENFLVHGKNIRYYMQMAFPHLFSIDPNGWCASASTYPILPFGDGESGVFELYKRRIFNNSSKFEQPLTQDNYIKTHYMVNEYVFFPCQLPHDETIKYHSLISVEDALRKTIEWAQKKIIPVVVVKGHPVNRAAMEPLKKIVNDMAHDVIWVDDISVHDLIKHSEAVFTVNSGVGLESLLHSKPVFTFGQADYTMVTHPLWRDTKIVDDEFFKFRWNHRDMYLTDYPAFIDTYVNTHYDTTDPESFKKLKVD